MFWELLDFFQEKRSRKTSCPSVRGHDPMIRGLICWGAPFGGLPMFGVFLGREHPCLMESMFGGFLGRGHPCLVAFCEPLPCGATYFLG
jgi:hypothetical protein